MSQLESTFEALKVLLPIAATAGAFVGTTIGGIWAARRSKRIERSMGKLNAELTDEGNGGFRADFSRFRKEMRDRIEQLDISVDRRFAGLDDRLTGIDTRLGSLDDRGDSIIDQQRMLFSQLDEQTADIRELKKQKVDRGD